LCESYEISWVWPREVIEQYGDMNDWRHFVGSGPFILADHVDGASWTFRKNAEYWAYDEKYPEYRLPYVDEYRILVIPDLSTRMAGLRTGKIDLLDLNAEQTQSITRTNSELVVIPYLNTGQPCVVLRVDTEPFTDIRVRKAMQMAIDLDKINDSYYLGYGDPTPGGQVGPACIGYYVPYEEWPEATKDVFRYNPQGARELLAEAGYPNGFKVQYDVSTALGGDPDLAQILKAYWADIGVDADINIVEPSAYYGNIWSKSHAPLSGWYVGNNYSPVNWYNIQFYSTFVWSTHMVNSAEYDAMVDTMTAEPNREEQQRLAREIFMYAVEQFWPVVLPRNPAFIVQQPWLKGHNAEYTLGGGHFYVKYARVWIDQDIKYEMTGRK